MLSIVSEGVSVGESVFVFVLEGGEREGVRVA
jgi:hypothetical protein